MKAELNWVSGPPTKPGKCLLAIRGSEDAIPAVVSGETGKIWSWTNPAVKYAPDSIVYHAAWPVFPRERDERWIECDKRTWEMLRGKLHIIYNDPSANGGIGAYIHEWHREGIPAARMEVNLYGHYGARFFRWQTDRELEAQKPALDGSEPIDEETVDEYLNRLVKEATPAWEGVDPEKFMDEVRRRAPFDQAVSLLRSLADLQNGPPLETYREQWESTMAAVHEFLRKNEV